MHDDLEDRGYHHDRDESVYGNDGSRRDYSVWKNDDGDEEWVEEGGESRNDALGFEDDEHFEDNML